MLRTRTNLSTVFVLGAALCGASLAAAAPGQLDEHQRNAFTGRLRGPKPAGRMEAVNELAKFPEPEAARLLIKFGLNDADDEIRRTAYATLLKSKDQPDVCDFLIDQLNQEMRHQHHDPNTPLLLAVLMSSELTDVQKATDRYFEKLATARDGAVFAAAMADLLAVHRQRADIEPLLYLAGSKLSQKFAVRRAIVRALTQIDDNEAIEALIIVAASFDGEAQADINEYLALVTRQQISDPADWAAWWRDNEAKFKFPEGLVRPEVRKFENLVYGTASQYYGLPLYARRLVFVIDTSGSMMEESSVGSGVSRLVAAKRELAAAILALKENVSFGIVVFNGAATHWRRDLIEATDTNKKIALLFVDRMGAEGGGTNTYDGLQSAFQYDAEAMYVLTDGEPTTGKIVGQIDIVQAITAQNRTRRESIYTIGVGVGTGLPEPTPAQAAAAAKLGVEPPERSPFEIFLRALAEQNHGLFRRVDQ